MALAARSPLPVGRRPSEVWQRALRARRAGIGRSGGARPPGGSAPEGPMGRLRAVGPTEFLGVVQLVSRQSV